MKLVFCTLIMAVVVAADQKSAQEYLKEGLEQFTNKLHTEVSKQHPGKSVVLSAFSVLPPLAELSLASEGNTHDEILKAIGIPNDNITKEAFSGINNKLRSVKGVTLNMANKIYVDKDYELNDEFAKLSKDIFDSEVQNIDFGNVDKSVSEINSWVAGKTNNRIPELLSNDALDGDTVSVLVNAIYFKGNWKNKFNVEGTQDRDFHVTKEKTVKVPMMFRSGEYRYGESKELNAKLLEIPYEGDEASFLIVLPNEIDGLAQLQNKLKDTTLLTAAQNNMFSMDVDVYLPKFKIETETNLKEALINMDIKAIFSGNAQLTKLLKGAKNLYVSKALQKAFIEVNEEGAEAAASNAFIVQLTSAFILPNFEANHPFVFFLKERENILFSGLFQS